MYKLDSECIRISTVCNPSCRFGVDVVGEGRGQEHSRRGPPQEESSEGHVYTTKRQQRLGL